MLGVGGSPPFTVLLVKRGGSPPCTVLLVKGGGSPPCTVLLVQGDHKLLLLLRQQCAQLVKEGDPPVW